MGIPLKYTMIDYSCERPDSLSPMQTFKELTCVCVLKLLLDQWTDLLHIWWEDAPHTRIKPELHYMTLGQGHHKG